MKQVFFSTYFFSLGLLHSFSAEVPALFKGIFEENKPRMAEAIAVIPPAELEKYVSKVEKNAMSDPAWFKEYSKKTNPGTPLPYHEKLGLTKEEYDAYIALWGKREFKVIEEVPMVLRNGSDKLWNLLNLGGNASVASLRYNSEEDTWKSSNGVLKRIEDIHSNPSSILGEWKGKEWRFQEETMFSKVKENIAIGETADGKYNLIVYRAQEITSEGKPVFDKSLVIRLVKAPAAPDKEKKELKPDQAQKADKKP